MAAVVCRRSRRWAGVDGAVEVDQVEVRTEPVSFLPIARMIERLDLATAESDTACFFDLCYLGELVVKLLVVELIAAMDEDRDRNRYALKYRLIRADGLGEWADVLDEALTGPSSQNLVQAGRDSQSALAGNQRVNQETWQRTAVMLLNQSCREIDPAYEDLSGQKVSVRQWVRMFVWLRNRTRGHGAPKSSTLSAVCPALRSSITEVIDNAPAFRRSWAHLRRSLSGKYKVSPFGGSREPFSHLAREADHTLPDGAYVVIGEPRSADLLITDTDLTDFFLPNGNFHSGLFELLSYVSDDRGSGDGKGYLLPAEAQPASETRAEPKLDVVGSVFTNMPPQREGYVRREALESELARLIRDDRHPIITLQGRGGVGKTSLALKVLHHIVEEGKFFAIVWFSARDIDLLPQGPKVVKADVLSTKDIAQDFADLMLSRPPAKLGEVMEYFTECLSGEAADGPFVFVLDNFETIRDQAELYTYLDNSIRPPNKVLITTRTRDFKADYPIEVRGMTRDEFATLVAESSKRLGISHLVDSQFEEELFEESGGHPYITKVLLGEIALAKRKVNLKRIVASKDAMLDALFDRSFSTLSPAAQRVFLTLCSWRSLVPRIGLEAVLLRPGNEERLDVERALDELEQCSLVEIVQEDGTDAIFLSVPLAAAVFGKRKLATSSLKIAIDADLELIRGFGATTTTDLARGSGLRVDRLAKGAAARAEQGADVSQDLAVIQYIASEYSPAWLDLAELQEYQLHDLLGAVESTSRYLQACPDDVDAWDRLIRLHRHIDDPLAEMQARLQLAELESARFEDLSSTANRLNGLLHKDEIRLDADERRLMVHKLRTLMEARYEEADAGDLSRLAWICLNDKDSIAAARWARAGLLMDPQNEHCLRLKTKLSQESIDV